MQEQESPLQNTSSTPQGSEPIVYLEWIAPAYRQTEKSKGWYAIMALMILLFVLYGLFFSDSTGWIVSITFLILAGVFYLGELKPAPQLRNKIMQNGVKWGNRFFRFQEIKSFWILNEENARYLHLTLQKGTMKNINIVLPEDMDMNLLREVLLVHVPEEEGREESFSEQLIRNLGL